MSDEDRRVEREEVDSLCPECGYAFKTFVDRILPDEMDSDRDQTIECPQCGCQECIVK